MTILEQFNDLSDDQKLEELQRMSTPTVVVTVVADPRYGLRLIHDIKELDLLCQLMNAAYEKAMRDKFDNEKVSNSKGSNDIRGDIRGRGDNVVEV